MKHILITFLSIISLQLFAQEKHIFHPDTKIEMPSGEIINFKKYYNIINSKKDFVVDFKNPKTVAEKYYVVKLITESQKKYRAKSLIFNKWKDSIIGTPAPKFEIIDMQGNIITSENTKGKPVFLNFWFTTCPPCIKEIPALNKIYKKYKDQVVFASISRNMKEKVLEFEKKHPIDMPVSVVSQNNIDVFNVKGFPTNIIIDSKGNYYSYLLGGRQDIEELLETKIKGALNP